MVTDKRAKTVSEAAYNHLLVFTQPVQAWPKELEERIPTFEELYLETPSTGRRPHPVTTLLARIRNSPGWSKHLLTGQRGSGKSWSLRHMGDTLHPAYNVVSVSATDDSGTTVADAEANDVLLLICAALSKQVTTWRAGSAGNLALARWVRQLGRLDAPPTVPDATDGLEVSIDAFFASFASRLRSDQDTRESIRKVGADDLLLVVNELLAVLNAARPVVILFDDLDQIDADFARRLFGSQFSVLAKVQARMVLTLPFSVTFENIAAVQPEVLRNVQVRDSKSSATLRPAALQQFTELLGRLIDLALIEGMAVEMAVEKSAGIAREFGRLLARAFEIAALSGADRVTTEHVEDAIVDGRVVLERAATDSDRRASLRSIRRTREILTATDRALLNENLVVEYVNGHPWWDVHPLLAEVVDGWLKTTA